MTWKFLKCDAEGCDHREGIEEYTRDLIGTPCPKCGANLLTEEDFVAGQAMFAASELLIKLGLCRTGDDEPREDESLMSFNVHGDTTNISVRRPKP